MFYKLLILSLIAIEINGKIFTGYKVFNVTPNSEDAVKQIRDIESNGIGEVWEDFVIAGRVNKMMVAGDKLNAFMDEIKKSDVSVVEAISDLQKAIEDQRKPSMTRNSDSFHTMTWDEYHNLADIYTWMEYLVSNYSSIVTPINIGKSVESRDIKGIMINYNPDKVKPIAVIEGTIHAREWIVPATVTWIIKELLTSDDVRVRSMAENIEWHFIPVLNPDGYEYTFDTDRMWRKNRSKARSTTCPAGDDMSNGVDLNRNFDFVWMNVSASSNPCDNTFAGPSAFSEPEARAIAEYVKMLDEKGDILYYFAFHSYTQLILVPYSHLTTSASIEVPDNYADMFVIAARGAAAIAERYGTYYRFGLSAHHMYQMSGTSFDWVKHNTNTSVSILFELRDTGEYGFLLPTEQIIPNNLEIMDGLIAMDQTTRALGYYYSSATKPFILSMALVIGVILSLVL